MRRFAVLVRAVTALAPALFGGCRSDEEPAAPGIDESFLDRTADPCSDFYQFACGAWIREHPTPAGFVESRFFEGDLRSDIYYQKLMTDPSSADADVVKARTFDNSCMALRSGASSSPAELASQLHRIALMANPSDVATTLAGLHDVGVDALFFASLAVDVGNPSRRVVALWHGGWSLNSTEQYGGDGTIAARYRTHITSLGAIAANEVRSTDAAAATALATLDTTAIFSLERAFAEATARPTELRDAVSTYNLTAAAALASMVPSFDWTTYFAARRFGAPDEVNLAEPAYFAGLQALLAAMPIERLKQYLSWRVLEAEASATTKPLLAEELGFHDQFLLGRSAPPPDWWVCLDATRSNFGFALARRFVERFVATDTKARAEQMVEQLRSAMHADLKSVPWLDDPTRARALEKLDALLAKVGYPDIWPSYGSITFAANASFLENLLTIRRARAVSNADLLGRPVDRSIFGLSPDTTDAFYGRGLNDITIPVAVLRAPFFSNDGAATWNLGSIGTLIGHEITHAFDDQGRHFDGTGKLTDWWTDSVGSEFGRRAQCLVEQFSAYEAVPGVAVDGALTLGENIADLGGLKLAYAASQSARAHDRLQTSFSDDQQFFLSFAQLWCANQSPEFLSQILPTDPHAPPKFRVNGAVRNIPAFGSAFHCPTGSPLAPSATSRCELW